MNIRQTILNTVSIFSVLFLLVSPPFLIYTLLYLEMAKHDFTAVGYVGLTSFIIFFYAIIAFMPVGFNIAWKIIKKEQRTKKDILFLVFLGFYLLIVSPLVATVIFPALALAAVFIGNKLMGKVNNWIKVALASIPVIGIIVCSIYIYFFHS